MVRVLGPIAADSPAHTLESRQAQRQHKLIVAIAHALKQA